MGIGGIRSNSAHFSGSEGRGIPRHCLLREKSKKPQLWARLRGSTWLLASVKSRPWNRPSMGREWEWTRTSRSRINKSCCCLPFHLSSAARSRPESYEISSPPGTISLAAAFVANLPPLFSSCSSLLLFEGIDLNRIEIGSFVRNENSWKITRKTVSNIKIPLNLIYNSLIKNIDLWNKYLFYFKLL